MITLERMPTTMTRNAGVLWGADDEWTPAAEAIQTVLTTRSGGDAGTALLEPGFAPPAAPEAAYDDDEDDDDFFDDDDDDDGEDTFDEFDDFDEEDEQEDDDEDDDDL